MSYEYGRRDGDYGACLDRCFQNAQQAWESEWRTVERLLPLTFNLWASLSTP
jgi:hypothetical protein